MIDVYYPYFEREASWQELRYSLRSIEQHFKFDFRVWIVGDIPSWINPETVNVIPHTRIEGIPENTLYDAITKLLLFIGHADTTDQFIRMYDDIYVLADADLVELGQFKAMYAFEKVPRRYGTWWDQLYKTLGVLRQKGYMAWNTETHLPEVFNKHRMSWINDVYGALEKRLLTSSLYWNTFYPFSQPRLWSKSYAVQFYGTQENEFYSDNTGDIARICEGRTYLNHNAAGLNENLQRFLEEKFPNPSKFELWK